LLAHQASSQQNGMETLVGQQHVPVGEGGREGAMSHFANLLLESI
jgi:hypothetical protein